MECQPNVNLQDGVSLLVITCVISCSYIYVCCPTLQVGETALMYACKMRDLVSAMTLLESGADPNTESKVSVSTYVTPMQ